MDMTGIPCRSCGATELHLVVSLGSTPLANRLLSQAELGEPEPTFPLDVAFCPRCTLVQITETVPPEVLFRHYLYFSSFSDALLAHARGIATSLISRRRLDGDSLVVEIASNDGYLLQYFKEAGVRVLGIEPAANIAKVAEDREIPTLNEFFGDAIAERLRRDGRQADVVIGNNVLAHVSDLNGFVRGVAILLKEHGVAQFEVPYVRDLIEKCEFDTIYHEHLCYYSLTALDALFTRDGLRVVDCERIGIHGGSLRVQAAPAASPEEASPRVRALLDEERVWGVADPERYADFGRRIDALSVELQALLGGLKRQGKRIAAYGAAAKGSTLLNCFQIGRDVIDFVVDRSTHKQGRYLPGVHIPILAPEELTRRMPDYTLLLAWNFADEIVAQQNEYVSRGGRFVVPLPQPRVMGR